MVQAPAAVPTDAVDALLDALTSVTAKHGGSAEWGDNSAPDEFTAGFTHALVARFDNASSLDSYLDDPEHAHAVDTIADLGIRVVVADLDSRRQRSRKGM